MEEETGGIPEREGRASLGPDEAVLGEGCLTRDENAHCTLDNMFGDGLRKRRIDLPGVLRLVV